MPSYAGLRQKSAGQVPMGVLFHPLTALGDNHAGSVKKLLSGH